VFVYLQVCCGDDVDDDDDDDDGGCGGCGGGGTVRRGDNIENLHPRHLQYPL